MISTTGCPLPKLKPVVYFTRPDIPYTVILPTIIAKSCSLSLFRTEGIVTFIQRLKPQINPYQKKRNCEGGVSCVSWKRSNYQLQESGPPRSCLLIEFCVASLLTFAERPPDPAPQLQCMP